LDILDEMRLRREQLLTGLEPCEADIEHLCFARQLAKQLLSSLPLENNKWSKIRIEKQNRLLDEMINNFNEDQFQMNSEAIMHSIKERIYFIDEMQKKFIDISNGQKNKLQEKLELLKMPFQKVFNKNKARKIEPEALFESLWQEIESERSKLLTKKP
jgi:vacuolar-type H+-ATPase subunit H